LGFCDRSPGRRRARCGGDSCRPRCCCGRPTTPFHPLLRAPRPGARVPPPSGPGCRIGLQEVVGVERFGLFATGFSRRQGAWCSTSGSPPSGLRSGFPRRRRRFGKQTPLQPRPHQLGNQGQLLFGWRRHGTGGGGVPSYETPPMGSNTGSLPLYRPPTTCEGCPHAPPELTGSRVRIHLLPGPAGPPTPSSTSLMQIINTLTVLALVVLSFALIVAIPVLYASSDDSGRSNRLILIGGGAWVALVLLNWGVSFFVV